jgi:hypothetical protein
MKFDPSQQPTVAVILADSTNSLPFTFQIVGTAAATNTSSSRIDCPHPSAAAGLRSLESSSGIHMLFLFLLKRENSCWQMTSVDCRKRKWKMKENKRVKCHQKQASDVLIIESMMLVMNDDELNGVDEMRLSGQQQ